MFNPNNQNEIVFPHIIVGNRLGGSTYTWNNVNAGVKAIGAFGFTSNNFLGGQCKIMGFIRELGLWACQDKTDHVKIRAFYMSEPSEVTPLGRKVIAEVFPAKHIAYVRFEDIPKTPEDFKLKAELQKRATELGYSPQRIDGAAVETLRSLIKVAEYDKEQELKANPQPVDDDEEPEKPINTPRKKTPQEVMAQAREAKKAKVSAVTE